jgi:hypothetical protein
VISEKLNRKKGYGIKCFKRPETPSQINNELLIDGIIIALIMKDFKGCAKKV